MIDEQKLIAWLEQKSRGLDGYDRRFVYRVLLSRISSGEFAPDAVDEFHTDEP